MRNSAYRNAQGVLVAINEDNGDGQWTISTVWKKVDLEQETPRLAAWGNVSSLARPLEQFGRLRGQETVVRSKIQG